jgi:hypothetical protein
LDQEPGEQAILIFLPVPIIGYWLIDFVPDSKIQPKTKNPPVLEGF